MVAIGLDVGTSGAKALLVDPDGRVLARAWRGYAVSAPESGAAELNPEEVIAAAEAVVAEVASAAPGEAGAIGISTQGEAIVPVDRHGLPLAPLMVSSDSRPGKVVAGIIAEMSAEEIYRRTGHTPAMLFTLFKLRWLAEQRPALHACAHRFHCVEDLIHRHWGLEPAMGFPLAGRTLLFDVQGGRWDAGLCSLARLRPEQLARTLPSGSVVDQLGSAVAGRLGVATGCRIVAGGHDQCCAALGAGAILPGQAVYGCGTVECITPTFATAVFSPSLCRANLCTYHAAVPGRWASVAYSLTGGNALEWFRSICGGVDHDILLAELGREPSPVLALPYLTPSGTPWFDGRTGGALTGLRLATTRGDILQGLLEGVAYEMRLNLEHFAAAGLSIDELRATGGGARDRRLCQLKADAIDRPLVLLDESEAGCLGTAAAAWAAFIGANSAAIASAWVRPTAIIEPRSAHRSAHAERFAAYTRQYRALADLAQETFPSC